MHQVLVLNDLQMWHVFPRGLHCSALKGNNPHRHLELGFAEPEEDGSLAVLSVENARVC